MTQCDWSRTFISAFKDFLGKNLSYHGRLGPFSSINSQKTIQVRVQISTRSTDSEGGPGYATLCYYLLNSNTLFSIFRALKTVWQTKRSGVGG